MQTTKEFKKKYLRNLRSTGNFVSLMSTTTRPGGDNVTSFFHSKYGPWNIAGNSLMISYPSISCKQCSMNNAIPIFLLTQRGIDKIDTADKFDSIIIRFTLHPE